MSIADAIYNTRNCVFLEPRGCPKNCGASLLGKDVAAHVTKWCPLRLVPCLEGCGQLVIGRDQEGAHVSVCRMNVILERAEVALRESAMKEVRLALAAAHEERARAFARMESRGERVVRKGWPAAKCTARVAEIEAVCQEMSVRLRRKAKERLIMLLAHGEQGETEGRVSAFKLWDSIDELADVQASNLGSRPWDLGGKGVTPLVEALAQAADCGADEKLRRKVEQLLLSVIRRLLQAAVASEDQAILQDSSERAQQALQAVELEGPGDVPELLQEVQNAMHHVKLQSVECSNEEFFEALTLGDVDMCTMLLRHERANPSGLDPKSGLPPIVLAAKAGDLPMCRELLLHRADVNARCEADGLSALHWAAHWRHSRTLELLLEGKANPRLKDWRGQDALMKLLRRDINGPATGCEWDWELKQGPDPLSGSELEGSGMLSLEDAKTAAETDPACAGFSFVDETGVGGVRFFISLRGRGGGRSNELSDQKDESVKTVWTSYLKVSREAIHDLRALLAAGADVLAEDDGGLTAMHHHFLSAPSKGSTAVVEALIKHNADVNHRDSTDRQTTPFLLAVSHRRADLVRMMLKTGWPPADVDARTADGTCALSLAEAGPSGGGEVARLLRDAGATIWQDAEVRLGKNTTFSFDSRLPIPG
eukprot:TRINITY_DN69959_c0_g1_i1.p1 TRINITY_DN69959_c0_g1~~TRINITY_DN69959_c0_g1_i1.p1  ORF type:complete len:653 (+),score=122.49 TRINITY_DN69959_c0_g1_i1:152-2110(+)